MKEYFTVLLMLFSILLLNATLLAQDDYLPSDQELSTHHINIMVNRGFLAAHHDFMEYYRLQGTVGIRASLEKQLKDGWAGNFGYIARGIEVYKTSLSNNQILGHAIHFLAYCNGGIHSRQQGKLKFGAGLAFLTQKFDLDKNIKNIAVGTTANAAVVLEYQYQLPFLEKYTIGPSIRFTHYSNGAFKLPNLGLNLISAGVFVQNSLSNQATIASSPPLPKKAHQLILAMTYGRSELRTTGSGQFGNANMSLQYHNSAKNKLIWGMGADLHYSEAYKNYYLESLTENEEEEAGMGTRMGVSAVTGIRLGRSEIHVNYGYYLYDQQALDGNTYSRVYFLTQLCEGVNGRIGLKAHSTAAETIEVGITKSIWTR